MISLFLDTCSAKLIVGVYNGIDPIVLNIEENERVSIASQNGVTKDFTIKISDHVKKDHLYAPIHYIETNALTPSVYDPYSKEPSFKTVAVNIIKK